MGTERQNKQLLCVDPDEGYFLFHYYNKILMNGALSSKDAAELCRRLDYADIFTRVICKMLEFNVKTTIVPTDLYSFFIFVLFHYFFHFLIVRCCFE